MYTILSGIRVRVCSFCFLILRSFWRSDIVFDISIYIDIVQRTVKLITITSRPEQSRLHSETDILKVSIVVIVDHPITSEEV